MSLFELDISAILTGKTGSCGQWQKVPAKMILSLSFACSLCRYVWINTWLLESFYCNKCGVARSSDIVSLHLCPASSTCDVCEWGALKGGAHGLRGGEDNSMEDSSTESHTALKWDQRKEIMWITQTHFLFIFNISVLLFKFLRLNGNLVIDIIRCICLSHCFLLQG